MNDNIAHVTNPENGEVTLYLKNCKGGPIVTGKDMVDAMLRWKDAFALYRVITDYPELLVPFEE